MFYRSLKIILVITATRDAGIDAKYPDKPI
jgi:hypothetical protein